MASKNELRNEENLTVGVYVLILWYRSTTLLELDCCACKSFWKQKIQAKTVSCKSNRLIELSTPERDVPWYASLEMVMVDH